MRKQLINKFLVEDPRTFNDDMDNKDAPEIWSAIYYNGLISNQTGYQTYQEFSHCNQLKLLERFLSLNIKSGVIVEIGVSRNNFENTSTYILTKYKTPETIYLGIDIDDKSFLDHKFPNTHTLISKSEYYQRVLEKFRELEITEIDFLFIDGWHSINQVIDELLWVEMVKPGGYIVYHDTNVHPGPSKIVDLFRPDMFSVEKCCESPLDWGISFVKKLV
jgi:hypothetical protein